MDVTDEIAELRARIARLEPRRGRWRLCWMRISSTWGWALPQENPPFLAEHLGARTLRGGHPVVYEPPE